MIVAPKTDHTDLIVSTIFKGDHARLRQLLPTLDDIDIWLMFGSVPFSPLKWAIHFGQCQCARVCIELGANINDMSDLTSPLQKALLHQEGADIVRLLLESGANIPSSRSRLGLSVIQTQLDQFMMGMQHRSNSRDMIWLLIDHGDQLQYYLGTESWAEEVISYRNKIRSTALLVCAMRMKNMDRNIMKWVGKQIWSMRQKE